jgi:hypothetical protein
MVEEKSVKNIALLTQRDENSQTSGKGITNQEKQTIQFSWFLNLLAREHCKYFPSLPQEFIFLSVRNF